MIKAFDLPLGQDIGPLYRFLRSRGLRIQVVEAGGRQELWAASAEEAEAARQAYEQYESSPELRQRLGSLRWRQKGPSGLSFWQDVSRFPLLLGLLASLLLSALYTGFGEAETANHLLIVDVTNRSIPMYMQEGWAALYPVLEDPAAWWRLLAPAWVHWGVAHWAFNCLGLWIFGRALEHYLGGLHLLTLVFGSAIISNVAQFLVSGPWFGGFSGVVYALVGAQIAGMQRVPQPGYWVPKALIVMTLIGLAAGLTGVFEQFGLAMANTAHLGGLISGWVIMQLLISGTNLKDSRP